MRDLKEIKELIEDLKVKKPQVEVIQEDLTRTFTREEYEDLQIVALTDNVKSTDLVRGKVFFYTEEWFGDNVVCTGVQIEGSLMVRIWICELVNKHCSIINNRIYKRLGKGKKYSFTLSK